MNPTNDHPRPDDLPRVSNATRERLRDATTPPEAMPTATDNAIRAAIADHFDARPAVIARVSARRWAWGLAAAAAVAVVATAPFFRGAITAPQPPTRTHLIAGDIDGDGTVDMLDAFALARLIDESAQPLTDTAFDLDGDGAISPADAEWIAQRAVSLSALEYAS